jgi:hypothetical protein
VRTTVVNNPEQLNFVSSVSCPEIKTKIKINYRCKKRSKFG